MLFNPFTRRAWKRKEVSAMRKATPVTYKHILVVDDEPDVREFVEKELPMCLLDKAEDYDTALEYLQSYIYDMVILDIMGVDGFKLLEETVRKGFPTVMLTAYALSSESLKKSIKFGAVSFLPKDKLPELKQYVEDAASDGGKPVWERLFRKLSTYLNLSF
jgi:DNA-binding NtrC family response regulator